MTKSICHGWYKYGIGVLIIFVLVNYYWNFDPPFSNYQHNCTIHDKTLDCFNNALNIQQDDPILVQLIRNKFLIPPPEKRTALPRKFNPTQNYFDRPTHILEKVSHILEKLSPGFFIECGALDGLMSSNTIWLERKYNWTGLLVEANQEDFLSLFELRRHAWISNFCLSLLPYPNKMKFYLAPEGGLPGVAGFRKREEYNTVPVQAQCVPLYTLLLALNRTIIDYFSLDVEGSEPEILETIPFDKVIFKVFNLENGNPGGAAVLKTFLEKRGYIFYKYSPSNEEHWDSIFLHSSIQHLAHEQTDP